MNLDHPTLYWTFVFVFVEGCFVCVCIFVFVFVFVEYVFTWDWFDPKEAAEELPLRSLGRREPET